PFTKWPATWDVKKLSERSAARVSKHPILTKIANATNLLRARRNDTNLPLQRTAWEKRRAEQKAALEAASPDYKKMPVKLTVTPLAESPAPATAPGPGRKADDRATSWRDTLARDPWVEESVWILTDMTAS